jgi:pimeloyl-ACP methyl ester carboxylesterase
MRRLLVLTSVFALFAVMAGGCSQPTETPVTPIVYGNPTQSADTSATQSAPVTQEPPTPTATPENPFATGAGPWPVTFLTMDGLTLHGTLYGQGTVGVIIAHMYTDSQVSWKPFAETLAAQGYRVLTFDLRGYGESEGEQRPAAATDDVMGAVAFMKQNAFQPLILIGEGIGGSAAILVAGQDTSIAGAAIISAPRAFPPDAAEQLLVTDADLAALTVPTLWIATRNDLTQNVEEMHDLAASTDKDMWIYEGSSVQGTVILEGADGTDLTRRLIEFVNRIAGA